ncbi:unnamed protein product [Fusarium graminearum]|uniref:Chromosome 4, complete genome n=1 Tax=Gibberella zeae (strain ATCC MYA-4620 / CBS 123657 / FGSC 9075 / NRRL 31084 / PH-1) TaxID=229533 RepID=I1RR16_GIBZE|nr:hypothetical protein FGSG_06520 [Fusarium graminearum PH-1]ESU12623.1 hypothetical protein FGSG_06520 [Fusarium graminearum PH-1]CEF85268.1 unnamed protein product [Fusarium graminearum]CZS72162.1 unnamed protein product [Fusarium graminearum]|eukprot:XP_011326130.1 hypothetical protein FGSG_06520 [Fusarium graminearum PH-1]
MTLQSTNVMSINNILNPEPSPPVNQPQLSNTYWPILRDALLRDPSSYHNLHLECVICLEDMTVFQHEHTYDPLMSHLSHRARIFPCGHMFGSKCAMTMIDELVRSNQPIACPICRVNFSHHRDCDHVHSGMPMPTSIREISPTLLFPFELDEGDSLFVSARTRCHVWDLRAMDSVEGYDVQDVIIEGPLKKVFDEIKARLKDNATRSWYSTDLKGFELCIRSCQRRRMSFVDVVREHQSAWNARPIIGTSNQ